MTLILLLIMLLTTIFFLILLRAGKEEENLLEERRRNRSESKNNKQNCFMENIETTVTMVKRYAHERPRRLEKKELTPLQLEFKEKCKKYPVIAVITPYHYKIPHYIGPPQFIKVREVDEYDSYDEYDERKTLTRYLEGNWITVDELDIEPPSGNCPRTLPICEIESYDADNKCYIWRESVKVKFYQEV